MEGLIIAKPHDKKFREDAIQYYTDHVDLRMQGCAKNLGISYNTLNRWMNEYHQKGVIEVRISGNYASDDKKEITRLKRELRDTQDALDVFKKIYQYFGKITKKLYTQVSEKVRRFKIWI